MLRLSILVAALLGLATRATAPTPAPRGEPAPRVAVVVKIPVPPGIDHATIVAGMTKTVPQYQALPGLVRKYFSISDDQKIGGIYLFQNRLAAEAHFNAEWKAQVEKTYGAPADVAYFEVPIIVDGPAR